MTWQEIKDVLDGMTPGQLKKEALYVGEYQSGHIDGIRLCEESLYWDGEDDPCTLKTKKQLKEEGYDSDDISGMELTVKKGQFYIQIQ